MTKPFLIVNVVDGKLGIIRERPDLDTAIALAADMAAEQCDTPWGEIFAELKQNGDFLSPDGDFHVHLAQTEDD